MARKSRDNPAIRDFIIANVARHSRDIAKLVAEQFAISRMTANRYLTKLVEEGLLLHSGETRARRYQLVNIVSERIEIDITKKTEEHIVWRNNIAPLLSKVPTNVLELLEYGATEIVNNVVDHSKSDKAQILVFQNAYEVEIIIRDFGVGIFKKIKNDCHLNDEREAIIELAKGKLTTDPDHHSGEGIFFTSRMSTQFWIYSGRLTYNHDAHEGDDGDWLMEDAENQDLQGTRVHICVALNNDRTIQSVFNEYQIDDEESGIGVFAKTHVPIRLALYPHEQLISRSQAKRVLTRFNKFSEVILDFKDVPMIGQGFADEIFRVFRNAHPEIALIPIRANATVREMIDHAAEGEDQPELFAGLTRGEPESR